MHPRRHEHGVSVDRNGAATVRLLNLTSQYMKVFRSGNEKEVKRIRRLIDTLYSQHVHETSTDTNRS